jgi:Na+-transporting NADH:ubiquinone oxidoreductase subunit B
MGEGAETAGAAEEAEVGFRLSELIRYQKTMFRVVLATVPAMAAGVYFFGWRTLLLVALAVVVGMFCEWLFARSRGEPITSAVFVTAVLYALSMPPRTPIMVMVVGIVVAVIFGKEVFGGYARNVFNPALVGRCFVYVCFPVAMTAEWLQPYTGFPAGLAAWGQGADAFTRATPLYLYKVGEGAAPLGDLFWGSVGGCIGETSSLMIIIGGVYLLWTKTASWRITIPVLVGSALTSAAFHYGGAETVPGPLFTLLSGGLLFGAFFMATDPISAAQTNEGRYIYGFLVGVLIVIIRGFSNFPGGVMFAILLMNMFNPLIDHSVREFKKSRKARAKAAAQAAKGAGGGEGGT